MSTYLPGVEADLKPGTYASLIEAAKREGREYSKIWDLFAFQPETNEHLSRFSHGVLRQPATISHGSAKRVATPPSDEKPPELPKNRAAISGM